MIFPNKQILHFAFRVMLFALLGMGIFARCAVQMQPQGGPKDSLPPQVVKWTPEYGKKNFKDKRIYIEFNEYVKLQDQQKEFYTSPFMKKKPSIMIRGRGIQLDISDTLLENTTYALNFCGAIQDNNEGNPLNGFRYVFSTGGDIDSMVMSGYTVDGYTRDSVSNTFIFFYEAGVDSIPDYDSTVFNVKPKVIGRAQKNGIFVAENLKPIPYKIYALEDKNNNQQYEPGVDKIGFLDSLYNPLHMPDFNIWYDTTRKYLVADPQLYIRMFSDDKFRRQNLMSYKRPSQHKVELQFGAPNPVIQSLKFDGIDSAKIITEYFTQGHDTIIYWLNVPAAELPDTIKGEITYLKHDSLNVLQPVTQKMALGWKFFESKEQEKTREKAEKAREAAIKEGKEPVKEENPFKYTVEAKDGVNPEKDIPFMFDYPLAAIDSAAISLIRIGEEDKMYKVRFNWEQDTANIHKWRLRAQWMPDQKYKLMIPQGALRNIAAQSNDTLQAEFNVLSPDKFATIVVNVIGKTPQSKYTLQLLNATGTVLQERVEAGNGRHTFRYVEPGEVKLRVMEDVNGNGVWDKGNLIKRLQPERVEVYMNDAGEEELVTKANWEVDFDVDMSKLFSPVTMDKLMERLRQIEAARIRKVLKAQEKDKYKPKTPQNPDSNNMNGQGGMGNMGGMGGRGGMQQQGNLNAR